MKKIILSLTASSMLAAAQAADSNRLDSLLSEWYEGTRTEAYEKYHHDFIELDSLDWLASSSVDQLPDSVFGGRLRMIASAIPLAYNPVVRRYIVAYTGRLKGQMEQMIGLSQYYFPIFEEELERQGLPHELKVLPMIESALTPTAVSRAGATGLWQFMLATGKSMGLTVNSFVDERMDPAASTRAAVRYLGQLFALYDDWLLAIAAYNCGPGNVNKALRRAPAGSATYWDIYDYLPRESRGYIPSFIAATYAYAFHRSHGMTPSEPALPMAVDTVTVAKMLHFEQISSTLDLPMETLRALNPQYKQDIVPATDRTWALTIPVQRAGEYAAREAEIHAKDSVYLAKYIDPANFDPNRASAMASGTTYRVRSGDNPGSIASKHGVSLSALMRANGLTQASARRLRVGQILQIP